MLNIYMVCNLQIEYVVKISKSDKISKQQHAINNKNEHFVSFIFFSFFPSLMYYLCHKNTVPHIVYIQYYMRLNHDILLKAAS